MERLGLCGAIAIAMAVLASVDAHYTGPKNMTVYMSSANVLPAVTGNGAGSASVVLRFTDVAVCWEDLRMSQSIAPLTVLTLRGKANSTSTGPVLVTLFTKYSPSGCTNITKTLVGNIYDGPNSYYLQIDNAAYPNGVARGQLGFILTFPVTGSSEVPASSTSLQGSVALTIGPDYVCYADLVVPSTLNLTGGAIHSGQASSTGPAVIPLFMGAPAPSGCGPATTAWTTLLLASPVNFYLNLYSASNPSGALRGQLILAYTPNFVVLATGSAVPGSSQGGNASLWFYVTQNQLCFSDGVYDASIPDPTSLVLSQGPAGSTNSTVLVNTPVTSANLASSTALCTTVDPALVARINQDPTQYFLSFNVGNGTERLRAQLGSYFNVPLSGSEVVPAISGAGASGDLEVTVGPNYICYTSEYISVNGTNRNVNLTQGGLYQSAAGVAGPKVLSLFDQAGTYGCAAASNTSAFLQSPDQYYIQVSYGNSVVGRGQLADGVYASVTNSPSPISNATLIRLPMGAPAAAPSAAVAATPTANSTTGAAATSGASLVFGFAAVISALFAAL